MTDSEAPAPQAQAHRGIRLEDVVSERIFTRLRREYEKKWGVRLVVLHGDGRLFMGTLPPGAGQGEALGLIRRQLTEAMRWGSPPFDLLADGGMVWLSPIMMNQRLLGGVAAFISRRRLYAGEGDIPTVNIREAADELVAMLVRENLTNAALLELNRGREMSERRRAEAIHAFKTYSLDFRAVYIREEPALMAAIRRGDREGARAVLNNILVVLHFQAGESLPLIKSFFLEMVTLMCRAAVESGCEARELLGKNYEAFSALSRIASDDELGPWLHDMLERLIDAIHNHRNDSPMAQLQSAMAYMNDNLHRELSRDEVAAVAHLSPAHFSRIFKKEMRESFTDMLNRMRVDQASTLLADGRLNLSEVALDCGFKDQSYFTKVFRKYMHTTPKDYRRRMAQSRQESGRLRSRS